jgi:hypothetical protein
MRINQCDCCGGKFGLVLQRHWSLGFCSRICKQVYKVQNKRALPWAELIARALPNHPNHASS